MSGLKTLADLFEHGLRDVYDAEKQILTALPEVIEAVADSGLREALMMHLEETDRQLGRLDEVFASIERQPGGNHCSGMAGILKESDHLVAQGGDEAVLDAALIATCQKVEHYEITSYGTLLAWAALLQYTDAIPLLAANEQEEKAADVKLSEMAVAAINPAAARVDDEGDEDANGEVAYDAADSAVKSADPFSPENIT